MGAREHTTGARVLLLGIDGADPELLDHWIDEGRLPGFAALLRQGLSGRVHVFPLASTFPAWTSVLTGAIPSDHGLLDFTRRVGYRVELQGAGSRRLPTLVAHLDGLGKKAASVGFPATYPPEKLKRGVVISGWDSPVTSVADPSFVEPPWLHRRLLAELGAGALDIEEPGADEMDLQGTSLGPRLRLAEGLARRARRRARLGEHLLGKDRWDLFSLYFGETDTASHHLWPLHDRSSPRRAESWSECREDPLLEVYQAVDALLPHLVAAARPEAVILVSDHGSGGASDKVLYLNHWLAEAGLQQRRERRGAGFAFAALRDRAPRLVPRALRGSLYRAAGRALPSLVESRVRFGGIELDKTTAFSEELPYAPSIWLNVSGREPRGTVDPTRRIETAQTLARRIESELLDPWTNRRVVRRAWLREEALEKGPYLELAPDLILELELDLGRYSYCLQPSSRFRGGSGPPPVWRRLEPEELAGSKGRSLAGSHRSEAILALSGPRFGTGTLAHPRHEDVVPTICALLDVMRPAEARGTSHLPGHEPQALSANDSSSGEDGPNPGYDRAQSSLMAERLRKLGYLD